MLGSACAHGAVSALRRRFAARRSGLALDVHPRVAMRILGHSKIAITMEIYTVNGARQSDTRRAQAAQRCPGFPDATLPDEAE
jgi:integrase